MRSPAILPTDKALIVMPLFHLGGKIEQMNFSLMGVTIVLKTAFEPDDILATIEREKVTAGHFAPLMVQRMVEVLESKPYDVSTLRCVHYASAPMPVPALRRAIAKMGPIFVQVYGMTECIACTILKAHHHLIDGSEAERRRLASAGQPALGNEVKIVHDDGSECEPGEIGEIIFRSPTAMTGYWNKSTMTAEILRDGWLHTQDLGFVDSAGFVFVVDRKKDMIISGGENIYSWEVEEALRAHPDVAEVAVIAVPDKQWGESVKACVQLRPGSAALPNGCLDRAHPHADRELQKATKHRFRRKPAAAVQRQDRQEGVAGALLAGPGAAGFLRFSGWPRCRRFAGSLFIKRRLQPDPADVQGLSL